MSSRHTLPLWNIKKCWSYYVSSQNEISVNWWLVEIILFWKRYRFLIRSFPLSSNYKKYFIQRIDSSVTVIIIVSVTITDIEETTDIRHRFEIETFDRLRSGSDHDESLISYSWSVSNKKRDHSRRTVIQRRLRYPIWVLRFSSLLCHTYRWTCLDYSSPWTIRPNLSSKLCIFWTPWSNTYATYTSDDTIDVIEFNELIRTSNSYVKVILMERVVCWTTSLTSDDIMFDSRRPKLEYESYSFVTQETLDVWSKDSQHFNHRS